MAEVVTLPKLGLDMTEGTFVNWVKKVGDSVKSGEVLAEIESDKATIEIESTATGVLTKTLVDVGQVVPVGAAIAEISAEDVAAATNAASSPASSDAANVAPAKPEVKEATPVPANGNNGSNGNKVPAPAPAVVSTGAEF